MNKARLLLLCGAFLLLSLTACGRKGALFLDSPPPRAAEPVMQPASSPVPVNQPQPSK